MKTPLLPETRIEKLESGDLLSLKGRLEKLRGMERNPNLFPEFEDLIRDSENGAVMGLFKGESLIGIANAFVLEGDRKEPVSAHVWVHPNHRKRGLGCALFEAKIKHLFSKPETRSVLADGESMRGRKILKAFGFKKQSNSKFYRVSRANWEKKA